MGNKGYKIVAIVACIIALVACYLAGEALYQNRQIQENMLGQQRAYMEYVDKELVQVTEKFYLMSQEDVSLLEEFGWEVLAVDVEKQTAEVKFQVVPRTYSPEETQVFITYKEKEYSMSLSNGIYELELEVPLFEDVLIERVDLTGTGTTWTEALNRSISVCNEYFPSVDVFIDYKDEYGKTVNNTYLWEIEADLEVNVLCKSTDFQVESIYLKGRIDGQDVQSRELYPAGQEEEKYGSYQMFEYEVQELYEIPADSEFILYVEVTDHEGFCYRYMLENYVAVQNEEEITLDYPSGLFSLGSLIYDEAGNLLYGSGKDIYQ